MSFCLLSSYRLIAFIIAQIVVALGRFERTRPYTSSLYQLALGNKCTSKVSLVLLILRNFYIICELKYRDE